MASRDILRWLASRASGSRTITLIGGGLVLMITVFTVVILHENEELAQASAEDHAVRMTKTVAQQLDSTLTTIDRAIRYAAAEVARTGAPQRLTDLGANGQLPTHLLTAFVYMATNGRIIASAMGRDILVRQPDLSDREYFRAMLGPEDKGTHVGHPVIGRKLARPLLPVSRTIRDGDGAAVGVLVAFLDLNVLERSWEEIGLLPQDAIDLLGPDGAVWARWPSTTPVGADAPAEGGMSAGPPDPPLLTQPLDDWRLTVQGGLDPRYLYRQADMAQLVIIGAALAASLLVTLFSLLLIQRTRQVSSERAAARQERAAAANLRHRLLAALHAVPVEFLEFDSGQRLVLANRAARDGSPWMDFDKHVGRTHAEMLRITEEHFRPANPARDWDEWRERRTHEFEAGGVFEVQRARGGWLQVTIALQRDGSRIIVRTDITELKKRMERLDSVFQSTGAAIILLDHEGCVVMANQAVLDLHGLSLGEVVGRPYRDLRFAGFDGAALGRWQDKANADNGASGATRLEPVEFECGVLSAAGERSVFRFTATPVQGESGELRYVVLIGVDDTQRRMAEVRLFDSSRLANLGEMASGIAHEINQPLAVIRLAAEALHEEMETPEAAVLAGELGDYIRQKLERISAQTERAAGIISDLRTVAHKPTNNAQPFDLSEAARVGGDLLREQFKLARIDVKLDLPIPGPQVLGEANRLQQIVINLMLNARDAILSGEAPPDGAIRGHLVLRVETDQQGERARLVVEDDGPGIPPAAMARLFEPFFTTKPVGKGTGLGLSISYDIVTRMGGDITAENRPGGGARFCISLPQVHVGAGADSRNDGSAGSGFILP